MSDYGDVLDKYNALLDKILERHGVTFPPPPPPPKSVIEVSDAALDANERYFRTDRRAGLRAAFKVMLREALEKAYGRTCGVNRQRFYYDLTGEQWPT